MTLLANMEDDCYSIALNGEWGSGKTFFIKQIKLLLDAQNPCSSMDNESRKAALETVNSKFTIPESYTTVYYDAWINDNHNDPILSLIYATISNNQSELTPEKNCSLSGVVAALASTLSGRDICTFINCNFDMAKFSNCDFRYATFENCYIPFNQMYKNLPHGQENLCADICKNLSIQCLKLGMVEDYKSYLFEERASGEIHSWKKMFHENNSYYARYNFFDGIKGISEYARSKASKLVWGYGERMSVLLRNMLIAVFSYAAIYFFNWNKIIWENLSSNRIISVLYFSACNFFSVSTKTVLKTQMLQFIGLSEHVIGLVFMGFFGAALFRQINRR